MTDWSQQPEPGEELSVSAKNHLNLIMFSLIDLLPIPNKEKRQKENRILEVFTNLLKTKTVMEAQRSRLNSASWSQVWMVMVLVH